MLMMRNQLHLSFAKISFGTKNNDAVLLYNMSLEFALSVTIELSALAAEYILLNEGREMEPCRGE